MSFPSAKAPLCSIPREGADEQARERMGKGRIHTAVCKAIHFLWKNIIGFTGILEIDSQYTFELWII